MQAAGLNTSRIGINIGAPVDESNEKSAIKIKVGIGKACADAQLSETKALIGGAEVGLSALLSFVASPGKQQELATLIDDLFNGKLQNKFSKDISQVALSGMISYSIYQTDGNRVVVQVKPGALTEDMVTQSVTGVVQGFGVEAATSAEKSELTINASAGVDFHDALEGHSTGLSTLATFGKSFKLEINATSPTDSLVEKKMWEIVSQFQPNSPLGLFKLLKTLDFDVTFRGIDELPADLQRRLKISKEMEKFPQTPKSREGSEEHLFFKQLVELMEPQIDIYATLENVVAIHASIRTPGWGKTFITVHD